jgi:hypothetical protein
MATRSSTLHLPCRLVLWLIALLLAVPAGAAEDGLNGFSLKSSSVPIEEILRGGPPRDGIPALDHPSMLAVNEADFRDDEWVIGIEWRGEARAYPIQILVWHELVNDTIANHPILVSYCPLCGTGMVFSRPTPDPMSEEADRFGVSGLLYQSDMLMYDRASESLWSQISAMAITGKRMGQRLEILRSAQQRWGDWRSTHPDTKVLSRNTGFRRSYGRSPYGSYATTRKLLFPVRQDRRYHPKMRTIGLRLDNGKARAYPAAELERHAETLIENFEGHEIRIRYDVERKRFSVEAPPKVEVVEAYWFAWAAFHPATTVYEAER